MLTPGSAHDATHDAAIVRMLDPVRFEAKRNETTAREERFAAERTDTVRYERVVRALREAAFAETGCGRANRLLGFAARFTPEVIFWHYGNSLP